jgi:hypothetical protein
LGVGLGGNFGKGEGDVPQHLVPGPPGVPADNLGQGDNYQMVQFCLGMVVTSRVSIHWDISFTHVAENVTFNLAIQTLSNINLTSKISTARLLGVLLRPFDSLVHRELVKDRALMLKKPLSRVLVKGWLGWMHCTQNIISGMP